MLILLSIYFDEKKNLTKCDIMISNNDLRRLAKSKYSQNRRSAALNPRIANLNAGQLLRNLAKNKAIFVRRGAALNPGIANLNNGQFLRNLAKNENYFIRRSVAWNPRIANLNDGKFLRNLAKNKEKNIRGGPASNPRSANVRGKNGRPLILALLDDKDGYVRGIARFSEAPKVLKNRQSEDNILNIIKHKTNFNLQTRPQGRVSHRSNRSRFARFPPNV